MEVDDRVRDALVITAAVLAIINHSIQVIERLLKVLRWAKRRLEQMITKQKPTNSAPRKRKRRK